MPIKIIITGPESAGKTTLAKALAKKLGTSMVPEFARFYLAHLGRTYEYNDLKTINLGQKYWEHWHERNYDSKALVCDTDWTVIRIWEQYRYGTIQVTAQEKLAPNTHYLLCVPDITWVPDPLREHPDERDTLFELYQQLLTEIQAPFTIIQGSLAQRLENSLSGIQKLY